MTEKLVFLPPKKTGIMLHAVVLVILLAGITGLLFLIFSQPASWALVFYLLGSLLIITLLPLVVYRGYALLHASYSVERDGLRVRWGLRSEDVPLTDIMWVRPASDLVTALRLPFFSVPGAILGESEHQELGKVEFIASSADTLVIVSAIEKTLVLSPEDPEEFTSRFQRVIEMGSLSPIDPHTAVPAAFFNQVLRDKLARTLIVLSISLALLLLVATSVIIPSRQVVALGYDISGQPLEPVPATRLLLLPIIALFFNFSDLILGLFTFRKPETRMIAYFLWTAGVITSVLLFFVLILIVIG